MTQTMDQRDREVTARYHARYRRQDRLFRALDRLLGLFVGRRPDDRTVCGTSPRRILLVNIGYLGDVIISTALLPVLRHAFPGVEIGFLTGPYSRHALEGHPLIARIHLVDHWYQSRRGGSRRQLFRAYVRALPGLIRELRAQRYDIAVDVRDWFPNLVPLLWMARIPVRLAHDRLGFGPLLTHRVSYVYERRHELDYLLELLGRLGVAADSLALARPNLAPPSPEARQEAARVIGGVARFRVLHPASSVPARDWRQDGWQALGRDLLAVGIVPVITGSGPRDKAIADAICAAVPGSLNAVDRLSWPGLVALLERAEAVYAVETSVGHVAAALGRPVISIQGGMTDPVRWAPIGAAVATNVLPCHPCLRTAGCATRDCLVGVTVGDVAAQARTLVPAG